MLVLQVMCCALLGIIVQQVSSSFIIGNPAPEFHKASYFAMRMDTNEGTCVSQFVNMFHPIYEFGENIDNGFRDWSQSWQLTGLEKRLEKFKYRHATDDSRPSPRINILAANATLLLSGGSLHGTLIELDHFNPDTNEKETRVRMCSNISSGEERECETVLHLNKTNYLHDGKRYGTIFIENRVNCENGNCTDTYHLYSGKWVNGLLGTWQNKWGKQDCVLARSSKKPGLFINEEQLSIIPIPGSESPKMSKRFTQAHGGKLFVHVVWKEYYNTPEQVQMYVRKLDSNLRANATRESKNHFGISSGQTISKVEFEDLEAGEYELTLYNVTNPIKNIYLCSENMCAAVDNNVPHRRIVGCHMFLGEMLSRTAEITISNSSQCNFNVSPLWSAGDLSYVCAQLGFKNTEHRDVDIKLCNNYGCVFTSCPDRGMRPTFNFTIHSKSRKSIVDGSSWPGYCRTYYDEQYLPY